MNEWDSRWKQLCVRNNIRVGKNNRYMDDIRAFLKAIKQGWRWRDGGLCYTKAWENEDKISGLSASRRSANILVEMMNDIFPFLSFTIELGEDFLDGKLPSLDCMIWVKDGWRILFQFFEKPMASNLMVEAGSALSMEVKSATLAEEVSRRLRNTSLDLDHSTRLEILERACVKMKTSGHTDTFIRRAVEQGIKAFAERVRRSHLEVDDPGFQPLYPKAGWRKDEKSKEKALKKGNWYKGAGDDEAWKKIPRAKGGVKKKFSQKAGDKKKLRKAVTVVFVPSTKGSHLIKSLRDEEDRMAELSGFRIKYQEAGGSVLANAFNKNLGKGQHCGRVSCPPCKNSEKRVNCKSKNIVYESKCKICNPASSLEETDHGVAQPSGSKSQPRNGIYIGETSRTLHERALEHVRDADAFCPKSHIVKHWMSAHPDLPSPPEMEFGITAQYRDCLSRQIGEALRIHFSADNILNSKGEYMSNSVRRLTIEEDAWQRKERSRREQEEEETNKRMVEGFKMLKRTGQDIPNILPEESPAYETDEEEFGGVVEDMVDDTEVVDVHAQYKTDEKVVIYETDEDEFMLPGGSRPDTTPVAPVLKTKPRKTRTKGSKKSVQISSHGFHLNYFNLWWNRMHREAEKEEKERIAKEEMDKRKRKLKCLLTGRGARIITITKKKENEEIILGGTSAGSDCYSDASYLSVGGSQNLTIMGEPRNLTEGVVAVKKINDNINEQSQAFEDRENDGMIFGQHHEGSLDFVPGSSFSVVWGDMGGIRKKVKVSQPEDKSSTL